MKLTQQEVSLLFFSLSTIEVDGNVTDRKYNTLTELAAAIGITDKLRQEGLQLAKNEQGELVKGPQGQDVFKTFPCELTFTDAEKDLALKVIERAWTIDEGKIYLGLKDKLVQ